MEKKRNFVWRIALVGLLSGLLSFIMCARLFKLEMSAPTVSVADPSSVKTTAYSYSVPAARGGIYDRYGRPLVTNTVQSDLVIDYLIYKRLPQSSAEIVSGLTEICRRFSQEWIDEFPLNADGSEFTDGGEHGKFLSDFIKNRGLDPDASASELMKKAADYYSLPSEWSPQKQRTVVGVLYTMAKQAFSNLTPYLFARDVSTELITAIAEEGYTCVRVQSSTQRVYHTTYAAHILGRLGKISSDEYDRLKDQGYGYNDTVGKDGAENAFESILRGIPGKTTAAYDPDGNIVEVLSRTDPIAGGNVLLTIDLDLQKTVEDSLASQIASMLKEAETNPSKPQDIAGAAAVVIKVDTGEILAMASYPTYDVSKFYSIYHDLASDPLSPMLNRAISGRYSPGSVFKMVTAVAGLETGVITADTVIKDTGRYTYYKDYQPTCWIYAYGVTHGDLTVKEAIRDSCNVYFYEVGRLIGIDTLSEYARSFGLGSYTGIELSGEARGYVASPEAKKQLTGAAWIGGDVLGASIGQSVHLYTPVQLCNYIATLVNGGTRYNAHLLRYSLSGDFSSVLSVTESVVENTVKMSRDTYQTVLEGMLEVTENGTASAVFKNYPIHVGGKTGSVEVSDGTANSVFCAFAPYDDPEIAVVIVVEHGGSGNAIAPVARDTFDAYFASDSSLAETEEENTIIW